MSLVSPIAAPTQAITTRTEGLSQSAELQETSRSRKEFAFELTRNRIYGSQDGG